MQRDMRGKRRGQRVWILRAALATLGLAGAVYAADQVTAPPANDDVGKLITNQRVREGGLAKPEPPANQREKLSPEQMIEEVAKFDGEAKIAYEHAEATRIQTYRSRDIIRMTCIDDKLTQMKEVMNVVGPRVQAFATLVSDDLRMRQHFLVLQQAHNRILELATEVEGCIGRQRSTRVSIGRIKEETPETDTITDPTRPPSPTRDIDRPGEASPYRSRSRAPRGCAAILAHALLWRACTAPCPGSCCARRCCRCRRCGAGRARCCGIDWAPARSGSRARRWRARRRERAGTGRSSGTPGAPRSGRRRTGCWRASAWGRSRRARRSRPAAPAGAPDAELGAHRRARRARCSTIPTLRARTRLRVAPSAVHGAGVVRWLGRTRRTTVRRGQRGRAGRAAVRAILAAAERWTPWDEVRAAAGGRRRRPTPTSCLLTLVDDGLLQSDLAPPIVGAAAGAYLRARLRGARRSGRGAGARARARRARAGDLARGTAALASLPGRRRRRRRPRRAGSPPARSRPRWSAPPSSARRASCRCWSACRTRWRRRPPSASRSRRWPTRLDAVTELFGGGAFDVAALARRATTASSCTDDDEDLQRAARPPTPGADAAARRNRRGRARAATRRRSTRDGAGPQALRDVTARPCPAARSCSWRRAAPTAAAAARHGLAAGPPRAGRRLVRPLRARAGADAIDAIGRAGSGRTAGAPAGELGRRRVRADAGAGRSGGATRARARAPWRSPAGRRRRADDGGELSPPRSSSSPIPTSPVAAGAARAGRPGRPSSRRRSRGSARDRARRHRTAAGRLEPAAPARVVGAAAGAARRAGVRAAAVARRLRGRSRPAGGCRRRCRKPAAIRAGGRRRGPAVRAGRRGRRDAPRRSDGARRGRRPGRARRASSRSAAARRGSSIATAPAGGGRHGGRRPRTPHVVRHAPRRGDPIGGRSRRPPSAAPRDWRTFQAVRPPGRQRDLLAAVAAEWSAPARHAARLDAWFFLPYVDGPGRRPHLRVRVHTPAIRRPFERRLRGTLRRARARA